MRVHLHLRLEWVTTTFDSQRRREALKGLPISCAAILASGLPSVSAAGSCEVGFAKLGVWLPVGSASFRKGDLSRLTRDAGPRCSPAASGMRPHTRRR